MGTVEFFYIFEGNDKITLIFAKRRGWAQLKLTTITDAFAYIEAFTNFEKAPDLTKRGYRLDRLNELCRRFDNPQLRVKGEGAKAIHIAGSKGKGSTAVFVASILNEAGFKTGIYTSPHLLSYTERIAVMGEDPDESLFISLTNRLKDVIDRLMSSNKEGESEDDVLPGGNSPTTFELLTLLAFLYFKEKKCDYVVYETGLGGRLDATNVIDPELSIITPIELEHTNLLGETLELIAAEKGGIIKEGKPVFVSRQRPEVSLVLRNIAGKRNCSYTEVEDVCRFEVGKGDTVKFLCLLDDSFNSDSTVEIEAVPGLAGAIQRENAALALAAVSSLFLDNTKIGTELSRCEKDGTEVSLQDVYVRGIENATLRGRMEILRKNPLFMIDSAHTVASIDAVLDYYSLLIKEKLLIKEDSPKILIFGCVADKEADSMIERLAPLFEKVIVCRPGTFKQSDPEGLYQKFLAQPSFRENQEDVSLLLEGTDALAESLRLCGTAGSILVTGSFFLAAEICKAWEADHK